MIKPFKIIGKLSIAVLILYFAASLIVPQYFDTKRNTVSHQLPYASGEKAQKLYNSLDFIADLHCDAPLWKRDIFKNIQVQ